MICCSLDSGLLRPSTVKTCLQMNLTHPSCPSCTFLAHPPLLLCYPRAQLLRYPKARLR